MSSPLSSTDTLAVGPGGPDMMWWPLKCMDALTRCSGDAVVLEVHGCHSSAMKAQGCQGCHGSEGPVMSSP